MQATTRAGTDIAPQGRPSVTVSVGDGRTETLQIPQSHDDMMALLQQRRVVSEQLDEATSRRDKLMNRILGAPESAKPGLQAQLNVLSDRIVQLESNLNVIGQEIAGASPSLMSMAAEPSPPTKDASFAEGAAAFGVPIFLIMSMFYVFQRRRWKREARWSQSALPAVDSDRLQRLEHGMEAMAIEVERISEGQRFVTKLLTESRTTEPAPR